jgi:acylphosphatase
MSGLTDPSAAAAGAGGRARVRVRVVVTGRVQGVFFRDSCRDRARAEGVGGWIRNRSDGAVEAEFEGSPDAVDRMVSWCRSGPPRARVDALEVSTESTLGDQRFRVL